MVYRPRWSQSIKPYIERFRLLSQQEQIHLLHKMLESDRIESSENSKNLMVTSKSSSRIKTLEQLLEASKVDLETYFVDRYNVNKWEVSAQIDGQLVTEELFQVKATLLRNKEKQIRKRIIDDLKSDFKTYRPIERSYDNLDGDFMLEVNIFDLHFGKLAWGEESGESFDTKIASDRFHSAIDKLMLRSQGYNISEIVFPIGNDFFNSDKSFPYNSTTKGTPQQEDLRWQKTFRNGRRLIVEAIDKLKEIAPVKVIVVQGNHDWERSYYLGDSIYSWFRNDPYVLVDNAPTSRMYHKFGNSLIGFTHGNNEKVGELPLLMASEQKKLWADTKYHEWHLGHLHHKKQFQFPSVNEQKGCVIRFMRSLSGTDAWHSVKGYVENVQSAESFIWHKHEGLVSHQFYNV